MKNRSRTWETVGRIYDQVHIALYAALLLFVLWFAAFVAPHISEYRARAEAQRIHEIAAEHDFYCGKFGMGPATPAYPQCVLDLQAFRAKVEQRMANDQEVF